MAAVGFWVFERLFRLSRHFYGRLHRQFIPRSPILKARASVASGAILLTVPFPHGAWEAGQHVYVSFWGLKMRESLLSWSSARSDVVAVKKPWTYGQSHPLSIFNIPSQDPTDPSGLQLVFKVHDGITKSLAAKIVADCASSGEKTVELSVSIEGPYGKAPIVRDYGTILLIGGGSGITHVGSVLYDIVEKIKAGTCTATQVRLVWAVQQLGTSL
jgi:NAD(P)H-flavin reductase